MIYLLLIAIAAIVYGFWIEPRWLAVRRYREPLVSHPTTWMRIVFLSDLHAGGAIPSEWWERVVNETNALAPDVVLLGGDYVVDRAAPIHDLLPLKKLHAPLGVYFVLGNHDFLDRPQDIRSFFVDQGFIDLTNRNVVLKREGKELELQGIDDHWYGAPKPFTRLSPKTPHVVLAHEPDVMLDMEQGTTDLVIVGHTHGGQVHLPILGAPWVPAILGGFADGGRKVLNGVPFIMGRGLGQEHLRPRVGARPEIVVVKVGV
jgi:predicted MPP superfamily phosphohydrolase